MAQAETNVVSSANVVGYVQKDLIPGQYMLAGVNFTANGEAPTLKEVVGTNQLTRSANYALADRVIIWKTNSSTYQAYATYTDGEFYPCNTADQWNNAVGSENPVVPVGTGFWIVPASGATTTNTLTFSGDVVAVETNTLNLKAGYQLISYPFSCDQAIKDMNTNNLTANVNYALADRIGVWEGDHYQYYGLYTDGSWYPCNTADEWNNAIAETDRVISIGEGFWFIAQNNKLLSETNKYFSAIQ
jgi:hypothetical protein